jgi:CBS domain-containing protein
MGAVERRFRRAATLSDRTKQEMADIAVERDERATRRFNIARVAASLPGSLREQRRTLARLIAAGAVPGVTETPSRSTLAALRAKWNDGAHALDDYRDQERSGRPRTPLDERLMDAARTLISNGSAPSIRALHTELEGPAAALGLPRPTYAVLRRIFGQHVIRRTAAKYGAAGAELDAIPHATVPARHTHDVWTLDELLLPAWIRSWNRVRKVWVSVRPWVVIVIDVRSRAALAALLVDPARRTDPATGEPAGAVTREDVLAALLSVACRELAPAATQELAGYLARTIRWDRAQAHRALESALHRIGVECRPLRATGLRTAAWSNARTAP